MKQALGRQRAGAASMAASSPNVSPALAMRMAMRQQTQQGLETAQQGGVLRAQEQIASQQLLERAIAGDRDAQLQLEQIKSQQAQIAAQVAIAQAEGETAKISSLICSRSKMPRACPERI